MTTAILTPAPAEQAATGTTDTFPRQPDRTDLRCATCPITGTSTCPEAGDPNCPEC